MVLFGSPKTGSMNCVLFRAQVRWGSPKKSAQKAGKDRHERCTDSLRARAASLGGWTPRHPSRRPRRSVLAPGPVRKRSGWQFDAFSRHDCMESRQWSFVQELVFYPWLFRWRAPCLAPSKRSFWCRGLLPARKCLSLFSESGLCWIRGIGLRANI